MKNRDVGKINPDMLKSYFDIMTSDVVLTEKQEKHIKEEHGLDYEDYAEHLETILEDPDYIIQSKKFTNFVVFHKDIDGNRYRLILRLKIPQDPDDYKNSIITIVNRMSKKRYERHVCKEKVLYKKENP